MTMDERKHQWAIHIENLRASGQTAAKWCEENQVNGYTLKSWIGRFNKKTWFENRRLDGWLWKRFRINVQSWNNK